MLKKDQEKQKATYQRIIVAIAVLVIILLVIVFGGTDTRIMHYQAF